MKLAYSLLNIKSIDEEQWIIEGIATTPAPDRVDDIVEPKGAQFTLPVPFLWQHYREKPIGYVIEATITDEGIKVKVQLVKPSEVESLELKELLQKAWDSIKTGLVRGMSIGFSAIEYVEISGTWGIRYTKWDWLELSAVTIAANQEATITSVKSLCQKEFSEKKTDTEKEKSVPCVKPEIIQTDKPKTCGVKLFEISESKSTGVKFA
ncbi:HK97 family phage prohead protease [Acinetobacter sp. NIPH 298]|uniref:HK97 family phage prohead protease n=1 Tax=Acinetobacter sp. NIPH 298 TaxID=1217692 RepID=UPI0002CEED27|nr:HK97 family phage prohead protease [Acinetobacter sp. NIPH 298]ENW95962.1 HK97 family phage prohead protease [Acinetobacter sp. NIPH 298]